MSSFKNFASMLDGLQKQAEGTRTIAGSSIEDFLSIAGYEDPEGGGGGGGDYPTVTVTMDGEKLYCGMSFGEGDEVYALYYNSTYYTYTYSFTEEQLTEGISANFLMIGESFTLYPNADFDLPDAVTVTGSATYDDETHEITVTGDCSIHLKGFDE